MYQTIVARLPDYALQRRVMPHIGTSMAAPLEIGSTTRSTRTRIATPEQARRIAPQQARPARRIGPITLTAPPLSCPWGPETKIGPDCNFFAISNCSKLSNRESRHKNAGNWPYCGLLPPSGDEKRAPNRKKVAKMPRFLFLRRAKPPQRAELPQRAERNRPNLQIQFHRNGAMVGPHDLGINVGHLHLFTQRFAHQEIVDAPPCVIGAGMETVAPPGVGTFGCRV